MGKLNKYLISSYLLMTVLWIVLMIAKMSLDKETVVPGYLQILIWAIFLNTSIAMIVFVGKMIKETRLLNKIIKKKKNNYG